MAKLVKVSELEELVKELKIKSTIDLPNLSSNIFFKIDSFRKANGNHCLAYSNNLDKYLTYVFKYLRAIGKECNIFASIQQFKDNKYQALDENAIDMEDLNLMAMQSNNTFATRILVLDKTNILAIKSQLEIIINKFAELRQDNWVLNINTYDAIGSKDKGNYRALNDTPIVNSWQEAMDYIDNLNI